MRLTRLGTLLMSALAVAVVLLGPGPREFHGPFRTMSTTDTVSSDNLVLELLADPVVSTSIVTDTGETLTASEHEVFVVIPARFSTVEREAPVTGTSLRVGETLYFPEPELVASNAWAVPAMPGIWTEQHSVFRVATRAFRSGGDLEFSWQDALSGTSQFTQQVVLRIPSDRLREETSHGVPSLEVTGAWSG